jgi:hypothetical protein
MPTVHAEIPCCSPATTESVAVVRDKVADARADILVGEGNILKSQGDYAASVNANTDRNTIATMSQIDKYGLATLDTVRDSANDLSRDHSNNFARLAAQGENGFYRTGVAIKELGFQASQNFGAVQLEACKNTGAIQLQAATNHKDSLLEQSKWFAIAEKTAMVNKCELADKLAECCCEIKGLVNSTAKETQSLIASQEAARVRDALAAATNENLFLRLSRQGGHGHGHGQGS